MLKEKKRKTKNKKKPIRHLTGRFYFILLDLIIKVWYNAFGVIFLEKIKKKLSKKVKIIITFIVVIAVILSGIIIVRTNETAVYTYVMYTLMPKTISAEEMHNNFDLSVRLNKNFDPKTQDSQPLEAFEYYYTDPKTGKEVVVGGTENVLINGDEVPAYLGFVIKAKMNLETIKSVLTRIAIVLVVILIAGVIVIWFKVWSKKEDEQKARLYKNSKNKK